MDTRCVPEVESRVSDGWDDQPGAGRLFLATGFSVIGSPQDGVCSGSSDLCTALGRSVLPAGMERLRGFLEGPTLALIEVAGVDEPRGERDEQVTVKLYAVSAGADCLVLAPDQLMDGQAVTRLRSFVNGSALVSTTTAAAKLDLGVRLEMEQLRFSADLTSRGKLERVVFSAALPARMLAAIPNPHCGVRNPLCWSYPVQGSVLEAVAFYADIDVDLDRPANGLERVDVGLEGRLNRCVWESGAEAPGPDCASDLSDGFSAAHSLVAEATELALCPREE